MRDLSDSTGYFGYGETPRESGDSSKTTTGQIAKDLIHKANTVPLINIFKYYNVKIDSIYNKSICPFKSHKNGRERTPSFKYFIETNSYYCYGCRVGGPQAHACEFVAAMDGLTRYQAASKIIRLFSSDIDETAEVFVGQDFSEQLEIMMDFSNAIRNFRKIYLDKESIDFIEKRCEVYDELNAKHEMDNETLRSVVEYLKEQIIYYKLCHTL